MKVKTVYVGQNMQSITSHIQWSTKWKRLNDKRGLSHYYSNDFGYDVHVLLVPKKNVIAIMAKELDEFMAGYILGSLCDRYDTEAASLRLCYGSDFAFADEAVHDVFTNLMNYESNSHKKFIREFTKFYNEVYLHTKAKLYADSMCQIDEKGHVRIKVGNTYSIMDKCPARLTGASKLSKIDVTAITPNSKGRRGRRGKSVDNYEACCAIYNSIKYLQTMFQPSSYEGLSATEYCTLMQETLYVSTLLKIAMELVMLDGVKVYCENGVYTIYHDGECYGLFDHIAKNFPKAKFDDNIWAHISAHALTDAVLDQAARAL